MAEQTVQWRRRKAGQDQRRWRRDKLGTYVPPWTKRGIVALSGLDSRTAALSQLNSGMPAISRLWSGAGVNSPFLLIRLFWVEIELAAVILGLDSGAAGGLDSERPLVLGSKTSHHTPLVLPGAQVRRSWWDGTLEWRPTGQRAKRSAPPFLGWGLGSRKILGKLRRNGGSGTIVVACGGCWFMVSWSANTPPDRYWPIIIISTSTKKSEQFKSRT